MKQPTQICRVCKHPKTIHHFSAAEWNRYAKTQCRGTCSACIRTKEPKAGGTEGWRRTMPRLFR